MLNHAGCLRLDLPSTQAIHMVRIITHRQTLSPSSSCGEHIDFATLFEYTYFHCRPPAPTIHSVVPTVLSNRPFDVAFPGSRSEKNSQCCSASATNNQDASPCQHSAGIPLEGSLSPLDVQHPGFEAWILLSI